MAQFIGLMALNAANFESGNAPQGYSLTADGSGGAGWQAASGGGGGTGPFDTVAVGLGEYQEGAGYRDVIVTLTNSNGGFPAGMYVVTLLGAVEPNIAGLRAGAVTIVETADAKAIFAHYQQCVVQVAAISDGSQAVITTRLAARGENGNGYIGVVMPDGTVYWSEAIAVPEWWN